MLTNRSKWCIVWLSTRAMKTSNSGETIMSSGKCAAPAGIVLMLVVVTLCAENVRKDLHFKVGKRPTISINNPYGPVVVRAGTSHIVVVTAILHSDKVELDESKSHNRVDIVSHLLPGANGSNGVVEYEIVVPPDANLTLRSENGRVHAEKLRGDVTVAGNEGAIEVIDCAGGHVHVRTLNGAVSLSNVHGDIEVMSVGGDVLMSGVTGDTVDGEFYNGQILTAGEFVGESD